MKESNITYMTDIQMYKQDIWFYSKYFDFLLYNNNGIQKSFGKIPDFISIDTNLQIKNISIWITNFLNYNIVCIQNLKTFEDKYYVVQSARFFSFKIKNQNFYIFVYRNLKWKINFVTNLNLKDFDIICSETEFIIKNKLFDSQIFQQKLNLSKLALELNKTGTIRGYIDAIDIYFFPDLFKKDIICRDIYNLLKWLEGYLLEWNFLLKINKYKDKRYPLWKINIRIKKSKIDIVELRNILTLFYAYYPNQYLIYAINNSNIIQQLKNFEMIMKLNIDSIVTNFEFPQNIMYYDGWFIEFQQDIMKLKYGFYIAKENYNILDSMSNIKSDNPHFQAAQSRINTNKKSLSKVIEKYKKTFQKLLSNLEDYYKQNINL